MSLTRLEPGTVVAGVYRIVKPLSEGGMGSVYVAEQVSTRKERALKLMRPELVSSEKMRERFTQEAHVGSKIDSEHVVEVIDAGIDQATGTPWLAMELLKGKTLAQACEAHVAMSAPAVRELFSQLCHAIAAAHAAGIIHRDLKPENIFLAVARREGVPYTLKVLDFGIAKLMSEATTRSTAAMGTPLFMPPEQMTPGRSITPAADVWALGLIAFLALTGKHYWHSGNQENSSAMMLLNEVTNLPIVPASQRAAELGCTKRLPPGFDAWFARCVNRTIEERFRDARELRLALDAALGPAVSSTDPTVALSALCAPPAEAVPDTAMTDRFETGPTQFAQPSEALQTGARARAQAVKRSYSGWVVAGGGVTAALTLFVVMFAGGSSMTGTMSKAKDRAGTQSSSKGTSFSTATAVASSMSSHDDLARPRHPSFAGSVQGPERQTPFRIELAGGYVAEATGSTVTYRHESVPNAPVVSVTTAAHSSLDAAAKAAVGAGQTVLSKEDFPGGWILHVEGPSSLEVRLTLASGLNRLSCTATLPRASGRPRLAAADGYCRSLRIDGMPASATGAPNASVASPPATRPITRSPRPQQPNVTDPKKK